ncbi:hypothetical protein QWY86_11800 [Pedobacter aquatilis]|uniref:hypothetical protein n=1 Tax=Pedobacter aquatilis TaxID=351343 RepID=UPI0025B4841B|nr:hypothetical protein [Pedobacter aquatilis]MDN3587357.1 hypothetical protein [Pedobacter aquatilis]
MKKLKIKQMEILVGGGMNQRNCMIAGATIIIGSGVGLLGFAGGFVLSGGAFLAAMSGDCF